MVFLEFYKHRPLQKCNILQAHNESITITFNLAVRCRRFY